MVEADPFLAFCYQIPADIVAETLLALADVAAPAVQDEIIPAFVVPIDIAVAECSSAEPMFTCITAICP